MVSSSSNPGFPHRRIRGGVLAGVGLRGGFPIVEPTPPHQHQPPETRLRSPQTPATPTPSPSHQPGATTPAAANWGHRCGHQGTTDTSTRKPGPQGEGTTARSTGQPPRQPRHQGGADRASPPPDTAPDLRVSHQNQDRLPLVTDGCGGTYQGKTWHGGGRAPPSPPAGTATKTPTPSLTCGVSRKTKIICHW